MMGEINFKNKKINIFLNKETLKKNSIIVSNDDVEVAVRCLCTKHIYFSKWPEIRGRRRCNVTTAM
jgi:hypothetical protein